MVRIIAVANQKGGVGKTTTSINLAASLAYFNKKTLIIDLDPQGNATSGLGRDKKQLIKTVFDLLMEGLPLADIRLSTPIKDLFLVPANRDLLAVESHLSGDDQGKLQLKKALQAYLSGNAESERPDYILLDCPPSLGQLTLNAIIAADSVLIPVQCEYYALEGLAEILSSCTLIRQRFNTELRMEGILLTMADRRLNLSRQVEEDIRKAYGDYVFQVVIHRNVRLSEAPSHGLPVILYDPISFGAGAYLSLAQEVMNHETKSSWSWPVRPTL